MSSDPVWLLVIVWTEKVVTVRGLVGRELVPRGHRR